MRRRVLEHEGRRSALLAADRGALACAQDEEQKRRKPANRGVAGYQAYSGGDERHEDDPGDQRSLAAMPIAVRRERQRADGSSEERHPEDGKRRDELADRIGPGKERGCQNGGERSVERKVVPLHKVAYAAGNQDPRTNLCRLASRGPLWTRLPRGYCFVIAICSRSSAAIM
jgi:hypothetical protein